MRVGKKPFCITKASGTNLSHLLYHKRIKIREKEKEQKQQQQKIKQEANQEKKNLCLWHNGVRSLNTANKGASPDLCPQCGRLLPLSGQSYCCSLPTQPALMACQT